MIQTLDEATVPLPVEGALPTDTAIEATIDAAIVSLWSEHRETKGSAKQTKLKLGDLRRQLGERLSAMKSILVRTGRGGGWAAYLRAHRLPRASADRFVKRHEASIALAANRPTEAIPAPTVEDVKRLVQTLLPRLRRLLTTEELVGEFIYEVVQQISAAPKQAAQC